MGTSGRCSKVLCSIACIGLFAVIILVVWMITTSDGDYDTHCVPSDSDIVGHYRCDSSTGVKICRPGYEGSLCKTEINECDSSPCQNGGICKNHLNYFTCYCLAGTTGDKCEVNLDECDSRPCQHQSSCIDKINGYECHCVDGYTGPTCSHEINECASRPCENGASCHDLVNGYTCECHSGYEGLRCEQQIAKCVDCGMKSAGSETSARQVLKPIGWFLMLIGVISFIRLCLGG